MDFFNKLGATITSGANTAKDKFNNAVEINNLNSQIKSCEEQLKNYYTEIGKAYFESTTLDAVTDATMKEKFEKVNEAKAAIETLTASLRKARGTVVCQKCGSEVPAGTVFCSTCGSKIGETVADASAETSGTVCPSCGKPVKDGAAFCASCGTKING